jgi:pimeloyl-ACP methyl ester carboxylesterase
MQLLAYEEAGSGHPLLLVHAGIVDRHMWDPVWEALTASHRAIRPDFRGFGETPVSFEAYASWSDLADLIRSLDAAPAHVVGVSMGGGASLDLALAEPGLVDRLVLVAPGLAGWDWRPELKADWEVEEDAWQRRDLDEVAWINVRTWVDGPLRGGEAPAEVRQATFDMYRHALELQAVDGATDPVSREPPARDHLAEVSVPTLVIVGDLDQPDMMDVGEHLAATIPGARLAVMHGVAHLPPMEAPDAFVDLVTGFLEA